MKTNVSVLIGTQAPSFHLEDKDGNKVRLNKIDSKYTIVYFYPKDNTPGCAIQAKSFTKKKAELEKLGATIIGISGGDQKTKTKFCEKNELNILLLSDSDFKVSEAYGVYGEKSFMGKRYMGIARTTFVLDKDKKIIQVYEKVKPQENADAIIAFLKEQS
jgi:peroxiredoxin Q/BCP